MSEAHLMMLELGFGVDEPSVSEAAELARIDADYSRAVLALVSTDRWFADLVVRGTMPGCLREAIEIIEFSNPGGG